MLNEAAVQAVAAQHPAVNTTWLRAAVARCSHGRAPWLHDVAAAIQVHQLSLALCADGPLFAITFDAQTDGEAPALPPQPSRLRALASATAWLAKETGGRLLAVLPLSLANHPALDTITYGACRLEAPLVVALPSDEVGTLTTVWPILGRPHPASPGERVLANRLAADEELRSLFAFNRRIETVRGTSHLVDLVWREGRVIVEIDGWAHTLERNYRGDRHRDYELLISGYLVLRLPHEQVVEDPTIALEKIRDVVRYCRGASPASGPRLAPGTP